jgi:S1-C subfamily serine protease
MRTLVALSLAVTISLGVVGCSLAQDMLAIERQLTQVVEDVSESIVSVSAVSSTPRAASGSGASGVRNLARSVGCGVVFDESGLIVTTASVVGYARYVEVATTGGAKYKGTVVGIDPTSDVAVIKVDTSDLKPARFAEAAHLMPGSLILILGNAFGALPSVAMGVVSNVTGAVSGGGDQGMLRLAVPINPGDIGGPVVNSAGEVVGVVIGRLTFQPRSHTMQVGEGAVFGFSASPQPSNMTMAIPIDRAMAIASDILDRGSTKKGFLGVQVMNLSDQLRGDLGDKSITGVMVTSVIPGSPAESIGIIPGDVITSFGSASIESVTGLGDAVGVAAPGEVVDIRYVRRGKAVKDGVRIGWFVPEFIRQAALLEEILSPEQVRSRINDLKAEMERLEEQLDQMETNQ